MRTLVWIGDIIVAGIMSFTLIDILPLGDHLLDDIDIIIKICFTLVGGVYYWGMHSYRKKVNKAKLDGMELDNQIKAETLQDLKDDNKKKQKE